MKIFGTPPPSGGYLTFVASRHLAIALPLSSCFLSYVYTSTVIKTRWSSIQVVIYQVKCNTSLRDACRLVKSACISVLH